jgi:phosphate transport system substrate-binding protein
MSIKKALLVVLGGIAASTFLFCGGGSGGSGETAKSAKKREITVISREESSGTRGAFDELMKIVEGGTNMLFREAVIVSSTDEAASKVEVDKNAIGYTSLGSVTSKVKALSIDGVSPNEANVKNGSYGISRPFVLAIKNGANNRIAEDFIKFTVSKAGQEVVSKNGYVTMDDATADYTAAGLSGKITLSGSTSVEKVVEKLKENYIALNPNIRIEINYNGSTAGIRDCIGGKSDIAMSSRQLKSEETAEITGSTFALDASAIVVNQTNDLSNISTENVTKIFKGEIRNWEDL